MLGWKSVGALHLSLLVMGSVMVVSDSETVELESPAAVSSCSVGNTCDPDADSQSMAGRITRIARGEFPDAAMAQGRSLSGNSDSLDALFASNQLISHRGHARFTVNMAHSTRYFEVSGDSSAELWTAVNGDANPLAVRPAARRKPLGAATVAYQYHYQPGYAADSTDCRVRSAAIDLEFETVLPRLKDFEQKPARLQQQWRQFQAAIIEHEVGHLKIYRGLSEQIPEALESVDKVPCSKLDERIQLAVEQVVSSVRKASDDYDLASQAGTSHHSHLQQVGMLDH